MHRLEAEIGTRSEYECELIDDGLGSAARSFKNGHECVLSNNGLQSVV